MSVVEYDRDNPATWAAFNARAWTIAYRKPRANKFHRATDLATDWDAAREIAKAVGNEHPDLQVWITTTAESERVGYTHAEDARNILTDSGRRVLVTDTGSLAALDIKWEKENV